MVWGHDHIEGNGAQSLHRGTGRDNAESWCPGDTAMGVGKRFTIVDTRKEGVGGGILLLWLQPPRVTTSMTGNRQSPGGDRLTISREQDGPSATDRPPGGLGGFVLVKRDFLLVQIGGSHRVRDLAAPLP